MKHRPELARTAGEATKYGLDPSLAVAQKLKEDGLPPPFGWRSLEPGEVVTAEAIRAAADAICRRGEE